MKIPLIILSCLGFLSACSRDPHQQVTNTQNKPSTPIDQTYACAQLSNAMQQISVKSKIEALETINRRLNICIQQAANPQQQAWITQSTQMYQKFLDTTANTEKQNTALQDYGYSILEQDEKQAEGAKIKGDTTLFKMLSPRDQYIFENNGKAYIDIFYVGEGTFVYRQHPSYLKNLVTDYLPADQKAFLNRLAKDNQALFMYDSAITIGWNALIDRALFWEKFIQQHPKSFYIRQAQSLYEDYQFYLFFGSSNTPMSDLYSSQHGYINEAALAHLKQLPNQKSSQLATKAQQFLAFLDIPLEDRGPLFNVAITDKYGELKSNEQLAQDQLIKALNLPNRLESTFYYHCHHQATCEE